jgi:hypothetical protein
MKEERDRRKRAREINRGREEEREEREGGRGRERREEERREEGSEEERGRELTYFAASRDSTVAMWKIGDQMSPEANNLPSVAPLLVRTEHSAKVRALGYHHSKKVCKKRKG